MLEPTTTQAPGRRPRVLQGANHNGPVPDGSWRMIAAVAAVDVAAVVLSMLAATQIRFGSPWAGVRGYHWWLALYAPLWWTGLLVAGAYGRRLRFDPLQEARRVVNGVTIGAAGAVLAAFVLGFHPSRLWAGIAWLTSLVAVALVRLGRRLVVKRMQARGLLRRRIVVVGSDDTARAIADTLGASREDAFDLVGFIGVEPGARTARDVIGSVGDLWRLVPALGVSDVFVSPSAVAAGSLEEVVAALDGVPVHVHVVPGLTGFLSSRLVLHPLGGQPVVSVERAELRPGQRVAKRAVDVVLAAIGLVVAAPIIAASAIAIALESGRPVIFRQRRVGRNGVDFTVYKMRTMVRDAERLRADVEDANEADGLLFKLRGDPRVTRVGRFLRRTSLDELPQLLNVLKGEMSLVGPRPPLREEVDRYQGTLARRLLVKPGITGLWQVSGRHELPWDEYVRYDLLYVQNWSLSLDLYILLRTIPAMLSTKGAY